MNAKHIVVVKMFEEEVIFLPKGIEEKQPRKNKAIVFGGSISKFF